MSMTASLWCVQLSSECRSLLDRIFVADVKQRITVEGIMQHPWYQQPLPPQYQSQLQHLDQVQAQKDAHIRSRRIDPVSPALTLQRIAVSISKQELLPQHTVLLTVAASLSLFTPVGVKPGLQRTKVASLAPTAQAT